MDSLHRCMSSTVIKNRTMTSITLALRLSLLLWCEFFMQKEMTHISSAVLLVCVRKSTSVVFAMNLSDIQTSLMYHREKGRRRRKQQLWALLVVLKKSYSAIHFFSTLLLCQRSPSPEAISVTDVWCHCQRMKQCLIFYISVDQNILLWQMLKSVSA